MLLSTCVYAQPPERFEVASIRPTQAAVGAGTSVNLFEGGRIRIVNEPVKLLVRQAFRVQDSQIAGGPTWLDSDRYDIEAKTGSPEKISPDQIGPLMRNLLLERFQLKFHRETREMAVLALVAGKSGPKLKPKAEGEATGSNTSGGKREFHMTATATSMELLASYVGNRLNRIVVDQTGLSDGYDFTLEWGGGRRDGLAFTAFDRGITGATWTQPASEEGSGGSSGDRQLEQAFRELNCSRRMTTMFRRVLALLLCLTGWLFAADDDCKEIVRKALQTNNHNRDLLRSYTHTERTEQRSLDRSGGVTRTKSETWDVVPLQGAQFRRLTLRDDKPLSAAEEQKQEAARQKQEAERAKRREQRENETPEQRQKRLAARDSRQKQQQKDIEDIVNGFDLKLVGEDQVDGIPVWVIDGTPRKGYKFQSREGNAFFSKMKGRIWVSKTDYQAVRIDAETTDTISFGLFLARISKGSHIEMEFAYINNEVWVPKREKATFAARIALVKGFHEEEESVYSNYKKFTADSRIVEIDK